tara:strand:- start:70 stop:453 length:384 start_codon:yes stop_codon:yes gene_type:complete
MAIIKDRKLFLRWFKYEEFNSPDEPLSYKKMEEELLKRLDFARTLAGIPFKITSGYRSRMHNRKVGGKPTSSHCKGLAADIYCDSNISRWKIIDSLIKARFNRIGIGKNFIHVDVDYDKSQDRIWLY